VFNPEGSAVEQKGQRAKTGGIDGELLLRTLMAYCRGQPRVVRIAQAPATEPEWVTKVLIN
jgi:transposase